MLQRIADGRTDLVFDFIEYGHPVDSKDSGGVSVINWCAYYGDVSAIRFLVEGSQTAGSVAIFEFDVPAGARIAGAHSHDGRYVAAYTNS